MLAVVLAALLSPMKAVAEPRLLEKSVDQMMNTAATYFYQSKVKRRTAEAACYFDPQVPKSFMCSWNSNSPEVDPYPLQQKVKRQARKWCTEAGGESCVLFYRNGKLRFDGLSPGETRRLESVFRHLPSYLSEATPLPEGATIAGTYRDWFERARDFWEERRKKLHGLRLSYAMCANERGTWVTYAMQGGERRALADVRRTCMLKCQVMAEWFSSKGACHVIYEDGRFASAAAERAVLRK